MATSTATSRFAVALLGRVLDGCARLLCVLVAGFLLFHVIPADPARALTQGRPMTAAELSALRAQLGLDRPLPQQLWSYLGGILRGDLGESFTYHRPVLGVIADHLWPTVLLAGGASLIAIVVGVYSGAYAGWRPGGRADRLTTAAAVVLWSTPTFWLGLILLIVLGTGVGPVPGLFPAGGMRSPSVAGGWWPGLLDVGRHLVLPCLTLVAVQYGKYHLTMRSSLTAERGGGYLTLARAKGLRDVTVRWRHAVPNAILPTLTLAMMDLGFVVSGAITVEAVYSWPGLGYLMYEALRVPDLPLLQGTFLLLSSSVIAVNMAADAAYRLIDPRVRRQ